MGQIKLDAAKLLVGFCSHPDVDEKIRRIRALRDAMRNRWGVTSASDIPESKDVEFLAWAAQFCKGYLMPNGGNAFANCADQLAAQADEMRTNAEVFKDYPAIEHALLKAGVALRAAADEIRKLSN